MANTISNGAKPSLAVLFLDIDKIIVSLENG